MFWFFNGEGGYGVPVLSGTSNVTPSQIFTRPGESVNSVTDFSPRIQGGDNGTKIMRARTVVTRLTGQPGQLTFQCVQYSVNSAGVITQLNSNTAVLVTGTNATAGDTFDDNVENYQTGDYWITGAVIYGTSGVDDQYRRYYLKDGVWNTVPSAWNVKYYGPSSNMRLLASDTGYLCELTDARTTQSGSSTTSVLKLGTDFSVTPTQKQVSDLVGGVSATIVQLLYFQGSTWYAVLGDGKVLRTDNNWQTAAVDTFFPANTKSLAYNSVDRIWMAVVGTGLQRFEVSGTGQTWTTVTPVDWVGDAVFWNGENCFYTVKYQFNPVFWLTNTRGDQ